LQDIISEATVALNPEVSVSCFGKTDAAVDYNITFGPDYIHPAQEIIQDNSGTEYSNGSLPAGEYCLTVKDANGCTSAVECFTVTEPDELNVTFQVTNGDCDDNDGTIDITVTGGTGGYSYNWADINTGFEPQDRFDLETGSYDLTVTDENGCSAAVLDINVELIFSADCISADIVADTIFVNETDTFCVDTSELPGNIISIENVCEDVSGEYVGFEVIEGTWCVTYLGYEPGTEEACIVICDDLGYCDTTTIYITVIDFGGPGDPEPPIAVDDFGSILINQSILIPVLDNDTLKGSLEDIYLVTHPINGIATLNLDGTISYRDINGYCDSYVPDTFDYAICNPVGCDTATVNITISCGELLVYTGVSPNGDGVNDVFFIEGIELYPNSIVSVFNRWGNEVFYQKSYKNDWNGTWKNQPLPDGTYFFVLEDGAGKSYSGYIQILR